MINTNEGYLEGGWKSESTRLNQIRFYNQVINNESNLTKTDFPHLNIRKFHQQVKENIHLFR